jgi:hypothetical protein
MYPMLIHAVAWIVPSDVVAGLLISVIAFGVSMVLLRWVFIA